MSAYLDDFAILVPKAAQKAQSKRSLTKNPYSDTPDRSLGDVDFYYNDDELVLNVGNLYGLFIGVNEYENEETAKSTTFKELRVFRRQLNHVGKPNEV